MASMTTLGKAIYVVPFAFLAGVTLQEYMESRHKIDEIVEKRVQQRLGVWRAPPLSEQERAVLLAERAALLAEIDALERRQQRQEARRAQ